MPTAYIKKLAKEGHGSVESLEKKWNTAKEKAKEEGKGDNFALITTIFQNMIGASSKLEAKQRLLGSIAVGAAQKFVPKPKYKSLEDIPDSGKRILSEAQKLARQYPKVLEALRNV